MIHVSGTFDTPNATEKSAVAVEDDRPVTAVVGEELLDDVVWLTADDDGVELGAVGAQPTLLLDETHQLRVLAAGTARSST